MADDLTLLETTRVSNSRSLRISLPRRVAEKISVEVGDIIGFYETIDGEIKIRKLT